MPPQHADDHYLTLKISWKEPNASELEANGEITVKKRNKRDVKLRDWV